MDKMPVAEKETLLTAIKAAQRHGLAIELVKEAPQIAHPQADAVARVRQGAQETLYLVECKRNLRPAPLGVTLHQMDRLGQPAMLITDYLAPDLAYALKERGIPFLDAAGNAYGCRGTRLDAAACAQYRAVPLDRGRGLSGKRSGLAKL